MSELATRRALVAAAEIVVKAKSARTKAMPESAGRVARLGGRAFDDMAADLLEVQQRAVPDRHLGLGDRFDRGGDPGVRVGHVGGYREPHLRDAVALRRGERSRRNQLDRRAGPLVVAGGGAAGGGPPAPSRR